MLSKPVIQLKELIQLLMQQYYEKMDLNQQLGKPYFFSSMCMYGEAPS